MKQSIIRAVCLVVLGGCGATSSREMLRPEALMTISEAEAARLSAAELVRRYVVDEESSALYLSSRECPAQSARVDSLLTGLLTLPRLGSRTRDYAHAWQWLMAECGDARITAWYRDAIRSGHDDLTVVSLTRGLLRTRDPANIAVVRQAAFDTANTADARRAILEIYVDELDFSGDERVSLMVESYRETGEVPGSFASDQAPLLWALRARSWREDLLAEVVADPGRRGAAPLLLTLARETRRSAEGSQWRKVWDMALDVLARHPQASADLKAMIPAAQEVARYTKD